MQPSESEQFKSAIREQFPSKPELPAPVAPNYYVETDADRKKLMDAILKQFGGQSK